MTTVAKISRCSVTSKIVGVHNAEEEDRTCTKIKLILAWVGYMAFGVC